MDFRREMKDVVETVRNAKHRGKSCSLLIGAGCSVKAGIPTAKGFVEVIKDRFPEAYKRAEQKTYAKCMAKLSAGESRDLIAEYVDEAIINWAHIGIAQLMEHGFVDRILTTNFDLLAVRACALIGLFPAVYDFAASQLFSPPDVPGHAIFYLHGQRTGFVIMNTEEQCKSHSGLLGPVFQDAGQGRVWLVVGYSGDNDPVFDHLAGVPRFDNSLYWVGHQDEEPSEHVRERLLTEGKYAFYVNGFDADDFFITLAQQLACFPPDLCAKPFSHLHACLDMVAPYPMPGQEAEMDVMERARTMIRAAIEQYERPAPTDAKRPAHERISPSALTTLLMAGHYAEVVRLGAEAAEDERLNLAGPLSWAYVMQGIALSDQARTKSGAQADRLFKLAGEKYEAALDIKPDMHEAFNNWGNALLEQAQTKSGAQADRLFKLAGEKYQAALDIKPDKHEALYNWGLALLEQARTKSGKQADQLFKLAGEKYEAALKVKPDLHEALNNWGTALSDQARTKSGKQADQLFELGGQKYEAALNIKPDQHQALNNWGTALSDQAKTKSGKQADQLFELAGEKYEAALKVKPDMHEALNNWSNALLEQARTKSGAQADRLFKLAGEKYQAALKIKPDKHEVLNNWGIALSEQAKTKSGDDADRLFALAGEKYEAALKIKPNMHEALNNWGNALLHQAKTKSGDDADRLFKLAGLKYEAALNIKPALHEVLNSWGAALLYRARIKTGDERDRLLAKAEQKLLKANSISAGAGTYNLACVYTLQGKAAECEKWLQKALAHGELPSRKHLQQDTDLASIRNKKWFKEFLAGLK